MDRFDDAVQLLKGNTSSQIKLGATHLGTCHSVVTKTVVISQDALCAVSDAHYSEFDIIEWVSRHVTETKGVYKIMCGKRNVRCVGREMTANMTEDLCSHNLSTHDSANNHTIFAQQHPDLGISYCAW